MSDLYGEYFDEEPEANQEIIIQYSILPKETSPDGIYIGEIDQVTSDSITVYTENGHEIHLVEHRGELCIQNIIEDDIMRVGEPDAIVDNISEY